MKRFNGYVHFVGIGGIGVSALARWFFANGYSVSGSDISASPLTVSLKKEGMHIMIGLQQRAHVPQKTTLLIYSAAVKTRGIDINAEVKEAIRRNIPIQSYPEAIGELTKKKITIAICGTHGKSTTTALVGVLLMNAGFDPTVIVGATVPEFGGKNFRLGKSQYLVLEADEWRGAFLHYEPHIVIWTTVDREHLDYFKNMADILRHFSIFLRKIHPRGFIIANGNDPLVVREVKKNHSSVKKFFYSIKDPYAKNIASHTRLIGRHNVSNALAVRKLAQKLDIPENVYLKTISTFLGLGRRMEYWGNMRGAMVFDDYAHHPTEIRTTLEGVREKYKIELQKRRKKLWCVFQPHQHQRTEYLFQEFKDAFAPADCIIFLDIYGVAGRESVRSSRRINSQMLARALAKKRKQAFYIPRFKEAAEFLKARVERGDIILVMGAGDVWKIRKYFKL